MSRSFALKIEAANLALMTEGNVDAIAEFFTEDYIAHLTEQEMTGGHAAIRKVIQMYRKAFPDLQAQVEILVASKDRVAWQRTVRGTHKGSFKGFPSTGQSVVWRDMVVSRFQDGLIAEEWIVTDLAEQLLLARKR